MTLRDPLYLPQVAAYEEGLARAQLLPENAGLMAVYGALMPGVYACIERFDLQGWEAFSPDRFPAQPRGEAVKLAAWLVNEVRAVYLEAAAPVPKASAATPTPKPLDSPAAESSASSDE
ncbi:MAG: hypothetical protein KIT46_04470 [Anaerolineales bacterium]|nr:hypothetical protein [Anaerolineales bacterium]MCW5855284.1 hypothetical protein [Anaerolineales bacterium]